MIKRAFATAGRNTTGSPGRNISLRKRKNSASFLSAADKLDDFVAVALFHGSLRPGGARKYFQVSLDGYATGIQAKRDEQICNPLAGVRLALFSVYDNRHRCFHRHVQPESWMPTRVLLLCRRHARPRLQLKFQLTLRIRLRSLDN